MDSNRGEIWRTVEEIDARIEAAEAEEKRAKRVKALESERRYRERHPDRAKITQLKKNKAKNEKYRNDSQYREVVKTRVKIWTENNRERVRATKKRYYERYPEKMKVLNRAKQLKQYGLTEVTWLEKFEAQGSKCACCGSTEPDGKWQTDHCHKTKRLRDILCVPCNTMIANHSAEKLRLGADYVERWFAVHTTIGG